MAMSIRLIVAAALSAAALVSCGPESAACDRAVVIDSVEYPVPERWCERWVDSTKWAEPTSLVRLPFELTKDSSRIYVTPATRDAFIAMAAAARKDSILLITDSGFRSPGFQRRLIKKRMALGQTFDEAVRFVAPPGFSQHHTARALDLVPSEARFADTEAYKWLRENAGDFGFEETYPEPENGDDYEYWEAWHWYYVGAGAESEAPNQD